MQLKPWIAAARLRTLPLAFSSIILGTCLAAADGRYSLSVFILSLLTTLFYQVLSNYANDYGDGVKGTDAHKVGEQRAVASGSISSAQMKSAVWFFAILSLISGTALSIIATRDLSIWVTATFCILGLLAVLAAIGYTVGNRAYGYKGLGDISVLAFFGYVGVVGAYFLQSNLWNWTVFMPATSVGLLAVGVLNLNNMRDLQTDKLAGKRTIPVMIGLPNAKIYQAALIIIAFDLAFVYNMLQEGSSWRNLYFITLPLLLISMVRSMRAQQAVEFDPMLKFLAITTLLFALLFGLGQVL
jgi:1,4-dihydroxy-2-naphthoate octaprenyltransferase